MFYSLHKNKNNAPKTTLGAKLNIKGELLPNITLREGQISLQANTDLNERRELHVESCFQHPKYFGKTNISWA